MSAPEASSEPQQKPRREPFGLVQHEIYWRDRYDWLLEHGYRLRPRYHPDWVPSWKTNSKLTAGGTEDSKSLPHIDLIDAVQVESDRPVVLKLVETHTSEEGLIVEYFSKEPVASDPRNHCIYSMDVLQPPDDAEHTLLVFPILRPYDNPDFDTFGEALDFIRQVLEGLAFLHEHKVAHRDLRSSNLMLDAKSMYNERYFCWAPDLKSDARHKVTAKRTRTETWPKYYIIDFGFSKMFQDQEHPLDVPKYASDLTVPEFINPDIPCDPFPIDVYTFGNLIRMDFIDGNRLSNHNGRLGFEFLRPLIEAMTKTKPEERITMQQALEQFEGIVSELTEWKLRARPIRIPGGYIFAPDTFERVGANVSHLYRKLKYVVKRMPPMPPVSTTAQPTAESASPSKAPAEDAQLDETPQVVDSESPSQSEQVKPSKPSE
ncbi:other/AgaK1 protein kinase [Ephemerocybe angulata]|uniref:Other/AgaK1 protein kinase n=1 Tax=Ephemerocybe angulata TaxID=980116 RepID=A0A8H6HXH5_9AGAR|nr:other/AgaK1 protein kinase [Tulosesus angulatus]